MEEEYYSSLSMEKTIKILRKSIFTFLQNFHYFTMVAAVFALPFAASALVSQAFVPSSTLLVLIQNRLRSLFVAAGFPRFSEFVTILNLKLSQTISVTLLVFPFTFTFLLFSKALIIQGLSDAKPSFRIEFTTILSVYKHLFITQLCNFLIILSANGTSFFVLFFAFNFFDALGFSSSNSIFILSASGAVLYSLILAFSFVVCNLALVLSGIERSGGYIAILKACVLIRGSTSTALSLALPLNMALASIEALFQYRVVRAYLCNETSSIYSMALEGVFIAYLYAIILVIDTIVGCLFFKSCKTTWQINHQQEIYCYGIQDEEKYCDYAWENSKLSQDFP